MKVYTIEIPVTITVDVFANDADDAVTDALLLSTEKLKALNYKVSLGDGDAVDCIEPGEHDDQR